MKIGDLNIGINLDTAGLKTQLKQVTNVAKQESKKIGLNIKKGLEGSIASSKKLVKGLGVALAGLGTSAILVGKDFEKGMSNVSTLIDTSSESMDDMKKQVLNLAKSSTKPLNELTSSLYDIRSAGISASDAMDTLKSAEKLATAGLSDTKEATDILTSSMNAFSSQGYNSNQIAEILFKTVKNGKTNISELAQGFGGVASLASSAGIDFKELASATATLTTTGLKASETYSAIKGVISNIMKPTSDAVKVSKELGIEFDANALKTKGLAGFLKDLKEKTGGNTETLSKLFGSVEGLNAVLGLTGKQAETFTGIIADMSKQSSDLDGAYKKQNQTFEASWTILNNNLKVILIELGTVILPKLASAVGVVAKAITKIIDFFKNWGEQSVWLRGLIVGLTAVIVGALVPAIYAGITAVSALTVALLANPITWIIAGIATAIGLLYVAWNKDFLGIRTITKEVFDFIGPYLIGIFQTIRETFVAFQELTNLSWSEFLDLLKFIWDETWTSIKEYLSGILDSIIDYLKSFGINAINTTNETFSGVYNSIKDWFGKAYDYVVGITGKISSAISRIKNSISKMISSAKKSISSIGSGIAGAVGFASGGYTGDGPANAVAGVVHKGEYVIPKGLVSAMPGLIQGLEGMRTGNISNDNSRRVEVGNVVVNNSLDLDETFGNLLWQLN